MPQYNPETNQYEETDDERKQREALGNTEVATQQVKTYADGSQTHTTTQEVPAPGFFDKLGTAVSQAGTNFVNNIQNAPENFVNNLKQGVENIQNAPSNFVNSVSNLGNTQPQASQQPIGPVIPTQTQPAFTPNYSLSTGEGAPGLRYGQAFVPQTTNASEQPAQPVQPVNPQQVQQSNNAKIIAQNESSSNPNIGYHYQPDSNGNRVSSAYGMFGITAPAYKDIQKSQRIKRFLTCRTRRARVTASGLVEN